MTNATNLDRPLRPAKLVADDGLGISATSCGAISYCAAAAGYTGLG
jgi:hypothetical protein